ncbi:hypothetical protein IAR55_000481 [Kwoniella newhampshirensis]|uniref:Uncharacterized protein n=1 Tax=Kwoniella newhampshirensis TaxID=1651941 RepID=A0AAW0Z6Q7_9TREE
MTTCNPDPTPISTLYATATTYIPSTIISSTSIIITPQPSIVTWTATRCDSVPTPPGRGPAGDGLVAESYGELPPGPAPTKLSRSGPNDNNKVEDGFGVKTTRVRSASVGQDEPAVSVLERNDAWQKEARGSRDLEGRDEKETATASSGSHKSATHWQSVVKKIDKDANKHRTSTLYKSSDSLYSKSEHNVVPGGGEKLRDRQARPFPFADANRPPVSVDLKDCFPVTSTSTSFAQPVTSWSPISSITYVASVISVPTQTIYGSVICPLLPTARHSSSSDTPKPTTSVDEFEGYWTTSLSSSAEGVSFTSATSSPVVPTSRSATVTSTFDSISSQSPSTLSSSNTSSSSRSTPISAPLTGLNTSSTPSTSIMPHSQSQDLAPSTTTDPTSSATSANDYSSPYNKGGATRAAIGGVIGLTALIAAALLVVRWWKRRGRAQRTRELRSSWFYAGGVREGSVHLDRGSGLNFTRQEKTSSPTPQSRFSAPSLISRHSLALPTFLSRPLSHLRQASLGSNTSIDTTNNSRLRPVSYFHNLRKSIVSSKDHGSLSGPRYTKKQNGRTPAWAEKYLDAAPIPIVGDDPQQNANAIERRLDPPRPALMDPPEEYGAALGESRYPDTFTSPPPRTAQATLSKMELSGPSSFTWGDSYSTPLTRDQMDVTRNEHNTLMPSIVFTAPTEASASIYSLPATAPLLNPNDTFTTICQTDLDRTPSDRSAKDPRLIQSAANSFPLPPLQFSVPTHPPAIAKTNDTIASDPNNHSVPFSQDKDLPPVPVMSDFLHRDPHDSRRVTQSTAHSSGTWEYATYGDTYSYYVQNRESSSPDVPAQKHRDTKDWYVKSLWDLEGSVAPMSVYHASVYGAMVDEEEVRNGSRKSVKSVRWEDEQGEPVARAL